MSDQASIGPTQTDADVPAMVDSLLRDAMDRGASDVHVEPVRDGYVIRIRLEGLLENVEHLDGNTGRALVMRLMVMGNLLTYHMDVPQEGRATATGPDDRSVDVRLAVMPTIHGPRATVRLPGAIQAPQNLGDLGLSEPTTAFLRDFAEADFGCLLLTGPAGCGKTTTIYALLRHLVENQPGMSIISLEDPVEADLTGVTQIQVMSFGDLTYERAIRSILRQDPQVLVIGEIRDPVTASLAMQASLSGHRLITTMHAGSPAGAITRLLEMGIEPYQITSALFGVATQRLLRRKAEEGYGRRVPVSEVARMDEKLREMVLQRADAGRLAQALAGQPDHRTMADEARELVTDRITDQAEADRVLGASRAEH